MFHFSEVHLKNPCESGDTRYLASSYSPASLSPYAYLSLLSLTLFSFYGFERDAGPSLLEQFHVVEKIEMEQGYKGKKNL